MMTRNYKQQQQQQQEQEQLVDRQAALRARQPHLSLQKRQQLPQPPPSCISARVLLYSFLSLTSFMVLVSSQSGAADEASVAATTRIAVENSNNTSRLRRINITSRRSGSQEQVSSTQQQHRERQEHYQVDTRDYGEPPVSHMQLMDATNHDHDHHRPRPRRAVFRVSSSAAPSFLLLQDERMETAAAAAAVTYLNPLFLSLPPSPPATTPPSPPLTMHLRASIPVNESGGGGSSSGHDNVNSSPIAGGTLMSDDLCAFTGTRICNGRLQVVAEQLVLTTAFSDHNSLPQLQGWLQARKIENIVFWVVFALASLVSGIMLARRVLDRWMTRKDGHQDEKIFDL